MSEFYRLRRTKITDGFALLGFVLGFLVPAYKAGKQMAEGFDLGLETEGLTAFVVTVLGNALIGGLLGLIVGYVVSLLWEALHKKVRRVQRRTAAVGSPDNSVQGEELSSSGFPVSRSVQNTLEKRDADSLDLSGIRFDSSGFTADEFIGLMGTSLNEDFDLPRTIEALDKTMNIGARDGDRLIGAVRVLSDGYLFSTIPEIIVDPGYRRRGVGRELMARALESSGTGVVMFGAPPEAAGFFERVGCQRSTSGFVLRKRVAPALRTK